MIIKVVAVVVSQDLLELQELHVRLFCPGKQSFCSNRIFFGLDNKRFIVYNAENICILKLLYSETTDEKKANFFSLAIHMCLVPSSDQNINYY